MTPVDKYSFQRYLKAKKSVDDRSLNYRVWKSMGEMISSRFASSSLNILELGSGIGTMLERILDWNLVQNAYYLGLDSEEENIAYAQRNLPQISVDLSYQRSIENGITLFQKPSQKIEICYETGDINVFASNSGNKNQWDLLIANAILDLFNLEQVLPKLFGLLKPLGYFYFSINFDGLSILEPIIDEELDRQILSLYHLSMDSRIVDDKLTGGSQTGRKLFHALSDAGGEILETGASDWVVYPKDGIYPLDEAYFLHHILYFFESSLTNHPDLDSKQFKSWLSTRHTQVNEGKLIYIAHQLDFFGQINNHGSIF